ncbi:MAG: hypothetical protein Q8M02_10365, partial [Candidatus Didemnitutus sp.]|nr:hypothetical protein [Candidatus Didemnitutus sp.]
SGIDAFAGLADNGTPTLGFQLGGVDLALVIQTDKANATRSWTTLEGNASRVAFIGVTGLTVEADTLALAINRAASDNTLVNFAHTPLTVSTGPGTDRTISLSSANGPTLRASGNVKVDVFGFVQLSGGFAFDKTQKTVKLADGTEVATDLLAIGGNGVNAFVGVNGPADSGYAMGFGLTGVNFALGLFSGKIGTSAVSWTSLQATASGFTVVGLPGLDISGDTLSVDINRFHGTVAGRDAADLVIDYTNTALTIATGPTTDFTFSMNGAQGSLTRASGNLALRVGDFFSVSGGFAFEKSRGTVTLADGRLVDADILTVGATRVDAFAGLNGSSPSRIGLTLTQGNFALALVADRANPGWRWMALRAGADEAAFVGIDGITLLGKGMLVEINRNTSFTTNTVLALNLSGTLGTVTFTLGAANGSFTIAQDSSSEAIAAGIKSALESIAAIGVGNVLVAGDRTEGYTLEFIGARAGQDLTGLSVATVAPTLTSGVTETSGSVASVNEVQQIRITVSAGSYGSFVLKFGDDLTTVITHTTDGAALATAMQNALAAVTSIGAGNVAVAFVAADSTATSQLFTVTFSGALAGKNVAQLAVRSLTTGVISNTRYTVEIGSPNATLTFGRSGDTSAISITSTQTDAAIIAALTSTLEALGSIGAGNVLVTGTRSAGFTIEFIGALARQAVSGLTLNTTYPPVQTTVVQIPATGTSANEIQAILITASLSASGTFTLSVGNYTTANIRFANSDITNNARRIREALEALPIIGAGNVSVVFDQSSTITAQRYLVTFRNGVSGRDFPTATADNTRLNGATVTIQDVQNGVSATRNAQRLTIVAGEGGTFRLSITDNGTTYLTSVLAIGASASDVARALTASWSPASSGTVTKENDTTYLISFNPSSFEGRNPALIVISAIPTGTPASLKLAQAGGAQLPLAGSIQISLSTTTEGRAPIGETQRVTIGQGADGTFTLSLTVDGNTYTTAAVNFSGTADQLATALTTALSGAYANVAITVKANGARSWDISFGGQLAGRNLADVVVALTVSVTDAALTTVQTGTTNTGGGGTVIDWKTQPLAVLTGPDSTTTLEIDGADGNVARASGYVHIQLFSFVTLAGNFAFEKKENLLRNATDTADEKFDILTIGSSDAYLFAGVGGPYWVDSNSDGFITNTDTPASAGAIGVAAGGVTAALAILKRGDIASTITYVGLNAHVASAAFVGVSPTIVLTAKNITIELNRARDSADSLARPAVFDFTRFGTTGLSVLTGGTPRDIAFAAQLERVTIGDATLAVSEFVYVRGALAFEIGPVTTIKDTAGVDHQVTSISIGGDNLYVFAGVGGPYWTDSNNDGVLDNTDTPVAAGAIGIALESVSLGLGIFKPTATTNTDQFIALKIRAASAVFLGVEGFTLSARGITIEANQVRSTNTTAKVLDFSQLLAGGFSVLTGGETIVLDFDSALLRVSVADATVAISEFLYIRGGFAFEKRAALEITNLGGVTKEVSVVTFGFSNAYVFAGVGGPYWTDSNNDGVVTGADVPNAAGALGIALGNVNVALAFFKPTDALDTITYTALKVEAASATLVGMGTLLTIDARNIKVAVNMASDSANPTFDPAAINFSLLTDGGFSVATGNDTLKLDFNSRLLRVEIGDATIAISEFVYVRGSFALEKGRTVNVATTASGTTTKELNALTLGASNAYVFAGVGGPYWTDSNGDGFVTSDDTPNAAGAVGLALGGVKLGLALFKPTTLTDTDSYYALSATAATGAFVGISGVTIDAKRISIAANGVRSTNPTAAALNLSGLAGGGLTVATGSGNVLLNHASKLLRVEVGDATLALSSFIYVRGGFAFEQGPVINVTDTANVVKSVRTLTIGASNAFVFAGLGGPYWTDSNNDGVVDSSDTPNASGAVGLALGGVDFGLALLTPVDAADLSRYTALKISAATATFVGLPAALTFTLADIKVSFNRATGPDATAPPAIDFSKLADGGLSVATGNAPVILDFTKSVVSVSVGNGQLSIANFVTISGAFAFEKSTDLVVVATNVTAGLAVGDFSVGIENGTLGLTILANGAVALEAGGTFFMRGFDFAGVTVTSVSVQYNTTGIDYAAANRTLSVDGIDATLTMGSGTTALPFIGFTAIGLRVNLGTIVSIGGDFSFTRGADAAGQAIVKIGVANFTMQL